MFQFDKSISTLINDVVIDQLPLESIPSTILKIKQCSISDLNKILKNTNAKIIKATFHPHEEDIDSITVTSRGMIKITTEIDDWVYLHLFVNKFLIELKLMEAY